MNRPAPAPARKNVFGATATTQWVPSASSRAHAPASSHAARHIAPAHRPPVSSSKLHAPKPVVLRRPASVKLAPKKAAIPLVHKLGKGPRPGFGLTTMTPKSAKPPVRRDALPRANESAPGAPFVPSSNAPAGGYMPVIQQDDEQAELEHQMAPSHEDAAEQSDSAARDSYEDESEGEEPEDDDEADQGEDDDAGDEESMGAIEALDALEGQLAVSGYGWGLLALGVATAAGVGWALGRALGRAEGR